MVIVVAATDSQWEELVGDTNNAGCIRVESAGEFVLHQTADAFLNLHEDAASFDYSSLTKPVIINAVTKTQKEINAGSNVVRVNGWTGFLQRPTWEVAGDADDKIATVLEMFNKKMMVVKDEPGLIAARVIAMIINEAYFALGDGISSKDEIDTAMKLGTNYPWGPFEWANRIGLKNILELLQCLSVTDKRYQPAPALIRETTVHS